MGMHRRNQIDNRLLCTTHCKALPTRQVMEFLYLSRDRIREELGYILGNSTAHEEQMRTQPATQAPGLLSCEPLRTRRLDFSRLLEWLVIFLNATALLFHCGRAPILRRDRTLSPRA